MRLGKILVGFSVSSAFAIGTSLFSLRQAEAQSSQPYVVFVNGWQNCCSWRMNTLQKRLMEQMNAEIKYVPYSTFRDGDKSNSTESDSAFLVEGANFINNQLDRNRPLILIGHSFGGDSVLKLLPRINRRIQFVAVLDPVSTGGFRSSLSGVPSNVDYFFNRWQENEPFPTDFVRSGSLQCSARNCDQQKQPFATDENFNVIRDKCGTFELCKSKNRRIGHQSLPTDAGVQRWLGDRISESLTAFHPPTQPRVGYFDNGSTVFYSNGTSYCGFVSPKHLEVYRKVNQAPSLEQENPSNFGTYRGACPLPSGYFDNGATVFFSAGNGTFCGFPNPPALLSHKQSRPPQQSFGNIGVDPNKYMRYTGVCQ
jgi:pimeloyl-ACP methyl ester carboxylesterase